MTTSCLKPKTNRMIQLAEIQQWNGRSKLDITKEWTPLLLCNPCKLIDHNLLQDLNKLSSSRRSIFKTQIIHYFKIFFKTSKRNVSGAIVISLRLANFLKLYITNVHVSVNNMSAASTNCQACKLKYHEISTYQFQLKLHPAQTKQNKKNV